MQTAQFGKFAFGIMATVAMLSACGPRDVAAGNGGGRTSEPVTVTKAGERPNTCAAKKSDRTFLRSPTDKDKDIFAGRVTAALSAGNENCLRIGAVVNLQNGESAPVRGQVTVTKIEIIPVESISDTHAPFFNVARGSDVRAMADFEINDVIAKGIFKPNGMISITYFTFNNGSQTDEVVLPTETSDIIVIDKEGERPNTCATKKPDRAFLRSPVDKDQDVLAGKITAALSAGNENCLRVGAVVNIQNGDKAPVRGQVTVKKIEILPVGSISDTHARYFNVASGSEVRAIADFEINDVLSKNIFDPKGMVSITYFELVGAGGTPTPPPTTPEVPVIDPAHYNHYLPRLKEKLSSQLANILAQHTLEWDASTLEVEYSKAVLIKSVPLDGDEAQTLSFPAYRVTFKTAKGSTLNVFNHIEGAERYLVMDANVVTEELTDVEGIVISTKTTWSSVSRDFAPMGTMIYNQTSGKMTQISLTVPEFTPFTIDVSLK